MHFGRSFAVALVLIAASSVQAAYARPWQATAELRAASCCAEHCRHSEPIADPARCCHVKSLDSEMAARSAASGPEPPAKSLVGAPPELATPAIPRVHSGLNDPISRRATPVFLLTRSLRL